MIKIYLKNKLFIKLSQLQKSQRDFIISKYRFSYSDFCPFTKKYITKNLNLFELVTWSNSEKWVSLPPNLEFFQNIMEELKLEYSLIDLRAKPTIDFPNIKLVPRDYQLKWLEDFEKHNYNGILTVGTGRGKSAFSIYIASMLKTPMIFVGAKTSYIESYKKEIAMFLGEDINVNDYVQTLTSDWFKGKMEIKPFNIVSVQTLSRNLQYLAEMQDKIGFAVLDEVHSNMFSTEYRKTIYSLNTRYKIFLTATPHIKSPEIVSSMVSQNRITDEGGIDFDIIYQPIVIDLNSQITREVLALENHNSKKSLVFSVERLQNSVADLVQFGTDNNRGVMVYSTTMDFQQKVSALLTEKGISNVIFNSNTDKNRYAEYLKEFDEGKIQVVIGGSALVEALSLYKLSLIIDCDLSLSPNGIEQLIGRLKRFNPEICNKQKVYLKLVYKGISEKKFRNTTLPVVKTMDYVKVHPTKFTDTYDLVGLFKHKL
jgi:superfamily II DNA or RNA helicase